MNLLDKYIVRQFILYFLLIMTALAAIYLLVDIFERLDNFQEKHLSSSLAARYFLIKIPQICDQIAPVCLLLAGVVTLGMLINRNELLTLHSAGISNAHVLRPFWAGAILMTLLSLAAAQWVVPKSYRGTDRIWREHVLGKKDVSTIRNGVTFFPGKRGIYTFTADIEEKNSFHNFRYLARDENGRQMILLYAQHAEWNGETWQFYKGQVKKREGDASFVITPFDALSMTLPEKAPELFAPALEAVEVKLTKLVRRALDAPKSAKRKALLDAHRRFSFLFLGLPLLTLALPLLFRFRYGHGTINLAIAIPASAGLAFCAWGAWGALQALAQGSILMPLPASWSVHLFCIVMGLLLRKRSV